jgi:hypothetical protein
MNSNLPGIIFSFETVPDSFEELTWRDELTRIITVASDSTCTNAFLGSLCRLRIDSMRAALATSPVPKPNPKPKKKAARKSRPPIAKMQAPVLTPVDGGSTHSPCAASELSYPHLPPLPWSYTSNAPEGHHEGTGFVYLHDANDRKIGTVWGRPDEKITLVRFLLDLTRSNLEGTLAPGFPLLADKPQNLPPLPWFYTTNAPEGHHEGKGFVYLHDADGRKIGTVWGKPDEKMATIQLVMDLSGSSMTSSSAHDFSALENAE